MADRATWLAIGAAASGALFFGLAVAARRPMRGHLGVARRRERKIPTKWLAHRWGELAAFGPQLEDDDVRFFLRHAGSSYRPGKETRDEGWIKSAIRLAAAEREAKARGWEVRWEAEPEPDLSWMDAEEQAREHEVLVAVLYDETGEARGSLGNIVDADRSYGRVIEAELALEALHDDKE